MSLTTYDSDGFFAPPPHSADIVIRHDASRRLRMVPTLNAQRFVNLKNGEVLVFEMELITRGDDIVIIKNWLDDVRRLVAPPEN